MRTKSTHLFTIAATLALLFACGPKKGPVRFISESGAYFFSSMDCETPQREALYFCESVVVLEETGEVVYNDGEIVIDPATSDTAYWVKIVRHGKEGYTLSYSLSDSTLLYPKKALVYPNEAKDIFRTESNENQKHFFRLANAKDGTATFDLEGLRAHLISNVWSTSDGYLKIHFQRDSTYSAEASDSNTGMWRLTKSGEVVMYKSLGANEPYRVLRFDNTFTLVSRESGHPEYYSLEYYENFSISPESQMVTEVPLAEINESNLMGTWVTQEVAPEGELLGYRFVKDDFYLGYNSNSELHGYWDYANYKYGGYWYYDNSERIIIMVYEKLKQEAADTTIISLTKFYNAAFEGVIESTRYIDEGGGHHPRIFYRSNGKSEDN